MSVVARFCFAHALVWRVLTFGTPDAIDLVRPPVLLNFAELSMIKLAQQSQDVELFNKQQSLRAEHYNATVDSIDHVTDDLMILRVRPDDGPRSFEAGQYTLLGLGTWEPRLPDMPPERDRETEHLDTHQARLVRRAYSISSPIFTDFGHLVRAGEGGVLEIYIALVRDSAKPAALTPRLFRLKAGDRMYVGPRCRGRYTLNRIKNPFDTVVFLATGCGEAPHNAMIVDLLMRRHRGRIVSVVCTRYIAELGYMGMHYLLERAFENYRYLTLTTREPRNLDRKHPHFLGKRYIQNYFAAGDLEEDAGVQFHPSNTHVFLCGNPSMVGVPLHTENQFQRYPQPTGMIELLEKRGFKIDRTDEPGQIHFEKYW